MKPNMLPKSVGRLRPIVEASALPAVRIRTGSAKVTDSTTASKYGGLPFTPEGFVWPRSISGRLMEFIGQVNFAEVAAQAPYSGSTLPQQGLIQFFYDLEKLVWGFNPADRAFWHFAWYPEPAAQQHRPLTETTSFPNKGFLVNFEMMTSWPDVWTVLPTLESRQAFSRQELDAYQAFASQGSPKHQLLGCSRNIQNDPRHTAQLVSHGLYLGNLDYRNDPRTPELLAGINKWQLLWQIDTDHKLGFMWGDVGTLYILIERDALLRADFTNLWLELQCS